MPLSVTKKGGGGLGDNFEVLLGFFSLDVLGGRSGDMILTQK